LIFSFVLFCAFQAANAQLVRVGILVVGLGQGATIHILDINYAPKSRFDVGLYSNLGIGGSGSGETATAQGGFGLGAQGKFFLTTGTVKPFVGLQVGSLFGGKFSVDESGEDIDADGGVLFQAVPQVGLRLGPLNIWGSYANKGVLFNAGFVFAFGSGFDK
jgi:hypothetical protein